MKKSNSDIAQTAIRFNNRLYMKKILFFIATTLMCSCTLYESEKDQLDNIVGKYWEEWKAVNRDTTCCVLDFDSIMPFEWDTLVYFYCLYPYEDKEEVKEYMRIHNLEDQRKYGPERLHFLKDGKIIHSVCLFMASDWAKGVYFYTDKEFIKRGRKDAKFHLIRDDKFLVIRDMTEEFVPMRSYSF